MSNKQPGKFKLSEAITPEGAPPAADAVEGRPGDAREPQDAQLQQGNAEVNSGIKSNKDRLIDSGRGHLAAGRGKGNRKTSG